MPRQKEKFLVIDTETCNTLEQPLPYDIGFAICDRQGYIYEERSYIVAETFLDMRDVMQSAYFAEKIPTYWNDIKNGTRLIKSIYTIRKEVRNLMKEYKIKKVGAYNMSFDKRALNNVMRYTTKSFCRWFFPFGTEYFDIWHMACQVLMNSRTYIRFAIENDLETEKGNLLTSAESCYKYITKMVNFEEEHKGLEDVRIEIDIMVKCFETHKKMDKSINSGCWRIPQRKRRELGL